MRIRMFWATPFRLALGFLVGWSSLTTTSVSGQELEAYIILRDSTPVSVGPYVDSETVSVLPAGTKVPVFGYVDSFWAVSLSGRKTGYIMDADLAEVSEYANMVRIGETPPQRTNQSVDSNPGRTSPTGFTGSDAYITPEATRTLLVQPKLSAEAMKISAAGGYNLRVSGFHSGFWEIRTALGDGYIEDMGLLFVSDAAAEYRVPASAVAPTTSKPSDPVTPCTDPVYLGLLEKDLNTMTDREFTIFVMKDRACNDYRVAGAN